MHVQSQMQLLKMNRLLRHHLIQRVFRTRVYTIFAIHAQVTLFIGGLSLTEKLDPVIIVAVISGDGKRLLLGRQKRFPPKWYSTLAGFLG